MDALVILLIVVAVCFGLAGAGSWRPRGLHVLAGGSPRGDYLHAVVARGSEIVHDPHPSRVGLMDHVDVTLIVPLDVTRFVEQAVGGKKRLV